MLFVSEILLDYFFLTESFKAINNVKFCETTVIVWDLNYSHRMVDFGSDYKCSVKSDVWHFDTSNQQLFTPHVSCDHRYRKRAVEINGGLPRGLSTARHVVDVKEKYGFVQQPKVRQTCISATHSVVTGTPFSYPALLLLPRTIHVAQVLLKDASIAVKGHVGAQEVSWRLRLAERL